MSIDNYKVIAEYIKPVEKLTVPDLPTPQWYAKHVRESQYLLQVVKCDDISCCKPMRSSLKTILKTGFLPPPYCLKQSKSNIVAPKPSTNEKENFASLLLRLSMDLKPNHDEFLQMPYDYFCPTVKNDLKDRVCKVCGLYFATKKGVKFHKEKVHGKITGTLSKIRPVKVVAKRKNELLCHITSSIDSVDADVAEWHEEELVDCENIDEPSNSVDILDIKIMDDIEAWVETPFVEET